MSSGSGDARAAFEQGNRLAENENREAAESEYARADELGHPSAAAYVGNADCETGQRGYPKKLIGVRPVPNNP